MKYLLAIGAMVALFGAAAAPALAVSCPTTTNHVNDLPAPPECALPETRAQHPDWFRDGGYCGAGPTTENVTGFTQSHCVYVDLIDE